MKRRLFTPGPTPVPEAVLLRMAAPLIHHRSPEFREVFARVTANLQYLFQTAQPVLTLTCSGTGGMEALIVSALAPGDTVLYVAGGKFGARWGDIARAHGMTGVEIRVPWGTAATVDQVLQAVRAHPQAAAVCLTHSETSTGVLTDVRAIAAAVHAHSDALVFVDGITSVGAHELRFDAWEIDGVVTGSQKGLMIPPGLAFCALSDRAWRAAARARTPRFYLDLVAARTALDAGDTPWTPAITLVLGLDTALAMLRDETLERVWRRHAALASAVRAGCEALGLRLFGAPPSNALTAVWLPPDIDGAAFLGALKNTYGITTAGGQGDYKGRIFRISHLGYYDAGDVAALFTCIELALQHAGYAFAAGAGLAAAHRVLLAAEKNA